MTKKEVKDFKNLVIKGIKWSLKKQDKVFNKDEKSKKLFKKVKEISTF